MQRYGGLQDRTSGEHLLHIKSPFPEVLPGPLSFPSRDGPRTLHISVLWHCCADAGWSWLESCISALVET